MQRRAALIIVDMQLDFCPGGALPVPEGDAVVSVLNRYSSLFWKRGSQIFATRDWHPRVSSHFREFGGTWPEHCVQGSPGAQFHPQLLLPKGTIVIYKGTTRWDDGYSALQGITENGTPLPMLLRHMSTDRLYIGGLATDYCIKNSVLDGLKDGFAVTLLADAVRPVEINPGDGESAVKEMLSAGATFATLETIDTLLSRDEE
jgi:nicotinamidase/pyrazinamidase